MDSVLLPVDRVSVLGMGRFGSFWASLLSTCFPVSVWSAHSAFQPYPFIQGNHPVETVEFEQLFSTPVLFLCNSIGSMETVSSKIAPFLKEGCLVMDTCSVKSYPLRVLEANLPQRVHILGTHPMFGPDSAKKGVKGLPVVLTPFRCSSQQIAQWEKIFLQMGLRVFSMSADSHDKEVAKTQALTHLVGRILEVMSNTMDESAIATAGYKKLQEVSLSVGKDSEDLFEAMQILNPYTSAMRDDFSVAFQKVLQSINQSPFNQTQGKEDGQKRTK